ncbi:hypothetical protein PF010_g2332 [Phytophthora fragariae]|uniref:Uncharacterized protein n=1 Tax=Phytophthora fragariae TaxID=53985 RepID=A0A6A3UHA0_9STRA|nr:hypothetical protein PF003_g6138 [Phytophthora fragariae]KAE8947515.1 hypothetical protein PF009_g2881 [Phytophthora fragariae]KAE9022413.1 hypothetical protein PF011_g4508 [Phytophthora fragariae]KAE9130036.1 hypothetical protein PF007_g4648 [Phytophthora fragariae]KAE9134767.1 hypothetical protein PF010_g2332 [Phytophthora fragariae]
MAPGANAVKTSPELAMVVVKVDSNRADTSRSGLFYAAAAETLESNVTNRCTEHQQ